MNKFGGYKYQKGERNLSADVQILIFKKFFKIYTLCKL